MRGRLPNANAVTSRGPRSGPTRKRHSSDASSRSRKRLPGAFIARRQSALLVLRAQPRLHPRAPTRRVRGKGLTKRTFSDLSNSQRRMRTFRSLSRRASSLHTATGACLRRQMGASASTPKAGTTRDGAVPAGSLRFTPNPAVEVWLAGGAPPPRSEASELLRPRAEALIQQLVVEGQTNENLATPSPQRALQAYENKYGEDAVTKAFGDKTTYLRSCKLPVTVRGTSRRRWWLGDGTPRGDRYFDARSEDAKEILMIDEGAPAALRKAAASSRERGSPSSARRPPS